MPKGEKKLRQVLRGDCFIQIEEIWRKGESYQNNQRGDNIQGRLHCKTVETNLGKLIPDTIKEKELTQTDLFVLSAAACLHDIGKVVGDDAKGWKSDHGKRSMEIILEEYDKLGLDRGQAIAVGHVVSAHGDGRLDELPRTPIAIGSEEVNVIELAAIFRLADMLDTSYQRAPEILSKIKFPDGNIPEKWRGRQSITGWYLDEKDRIILQAVPKKDELDVSYTLKAMMNEDLAKITPYLKLAGYLSELGDLDVGDSFIKSSLKDRALIQRPFPGMAFYTKDDASIFKGRDSEIENLLSIITNWPITLLIGESGAGKTSLIQAGLFPKLETILWKFVWTRPFANPAENIKKIIWSAFFEGKVDRTKSLLDVMRQAAEKCKPHQLLVVMDQFEDILNCDVQEILDDFSLHLLAAQTGTIIPNLKILISFREDALVKLNSRLLKKITGSAQQFPSVELERLTREGAKAAFLAGLENAGIGLDPRQEKGEKQLIEIILDDIQKGDDRLYPPYIQIVAETLCKKIDPNNPIITREIYLEELKGADNIIARYLIERLNEFGSQKDKAEKVLISLTSSKGEKAQKSLIDLSRETEIAIDELKDILTKMIDLRMARAISEDEFEIIHDHLGKIVDEELVNEEDRAIKFLEEQLDSFYQNYKVHGTPIMSPPFMASLYKNRRRIKISEEKYQFILCTCFTGEWGPGWYWLKDLEVERIHELIRGLSSHSISTIRKEVTETLAKIGKPEDWDRIIELLHDKDHEVYLSAAEALAEIAKPEDRDRVIELLHDEEQGVRRAAVMALAEIAKPEDRDKVIELLYDEAVSIICAASKALVKIVKPGDRDKVIELLHDEEWRVRTGAVEALAKIVKPEDRERIIELLHDEEQGVRRAAVKALAKIGKHEDRERIIELLDDAEWPVREAAAMALTKIAKPEDWDRIIKLFHDEEQAVRQAAAMALAKIAKPEDWDRIIKLFHDEDFGVQWAAADVLAEIAKPEDRDRIIELLDDEKNGVRRGAYKALAEIAKPEDRDKLIELLDDEDFIVRWTAGDALLKIATSEQEDLLDLLADAAQGWSDKQRDCFRILSYLDKKYYRPYFTEENDGE